jgi:hypothetical protein
VQIISLDLTQAAKSLGITEPPIIDTFQKNNQNIPFMFQTGSTPVEDSNTLRLKLD